MRRWHLITAFFVALIAFDAVLAWTGDKIALVTLAVIAAFLAVLSGYSGNGWARALDSWGRSTEGWAAAQKWGIKQDQILRDVFKELYEYDEEAVEIHNGRSATASLEYLRTFNDEDAAYITEGLREESP